MDASVGEGCLAFCVNGKKEQYQAGEDECSCERRTLVEGFDVAFVVGIEHSEDDGVGRGVIVGCPMQDVLYDMYECENDKGVYPDFPSDSTGALVAG